MDALEQYFDSFDIMSIPLETRKKWYKSYEATDILLTDLAISAYDDEDENFDFEYTPRPNNKKYIGESQLFKDVEITSSCKEAVENLIDVYHLEEEQFQIETPNKEEICRVSNTPLIYRDRLTAIIPTIGTNLDIVDREMSRYGFKRVQTRKQKDFLGYWSIALYNPMKPTDITTFIRLKRLYLWHYTPAFNYNSIMKNGLILTKDNRFNVGENRLHFYATDGFLKPTIKFENMLYSIARYTKKHHPDFDFKFNKYIIMADKLPDNITFKLDPNMTDSVFTTSTISIDYISNIEETYIYPPSN